MSMEVNVKLVGFNRIDFDRRKVRAWIRKAAGEVRKEARGLVARRGTSNGSEYPGKQHGLLQRSIRVRLARVSEQGGLWGWVGPVKIAGMKDFYPAILVHGVKKGRPRLKSHKKHTEVSTAKWRIEPRGNYMQDALEKRQAGLRTQARDALRDALKGRE